MAFGDTLRLGDQSVGVISVVESTVVHAHAALAQLLGEVAHRRQHHGDLLRMVRDVAAFVLDLAQRHHGVGWGIAQDLEVVAELIAEHQQKRLGHGLT